MTAAAAASSSPRSYQLQTAASANLNVTAPPTSKERPLGSVNSRRRSRLSITGVIKAFGDDSRTFPLKPQTSQAPVARLLKLISR